MSLQFYMNIVLAFPLPVHDLVPDVFRRQRLRHGEDTTTTLPPESELPLCLPPAASEPMAPKKFAIIAERSEANNRDLWAQQSQLASIYIYIYIYFHMGDVCHAWGAPGQQHVFKMASLVVTWMPSSNLWRPKTQTFGQIYHILLPGKAYYSSSKMFADFSP